jgi:RNA polymerase sigma factor (sigma-70 family)
LTDKFSENPKQRIFSAEIPPDLRENYKRLPLIENQIREVLQLSGNDFSARLEIKDASSEKYLKGETLIGLLNIARAENLSHIQDSIAAKLARICENLIRKFLRAKGLSESFIEEAVSAIIGGFFGQILERKEKSYDFWEVNFYVSLQRLTTNYLRKRESKSKLTNTFSELSNVETDEFNYENNLRKPEILSIEKKIEIKEILMKMPDENRKIFILHRVDGWTQEQIAEVFGITARTVRNRLKQIDEFLQNFRSEQGAKNE